MDFIKRIWQKLPIAFPLIGVFHLLCLLYLVYSAIDDPLGGWMYLQPVYLLLYTATWLLICDGRRWAVMVYIALTALNLLLFYLLTNQMDKVYFTANIFPADVVFSLVLFIYFKKLKTNAADGNRPDGAGGDV